MKLTLGTDHATRKATPMLAGLFGYFFAALAGIARHSKRSNEQHNGNEPMHWARGKSNDHGECILRHLGDAEDMQAFMRRNQPPGRDYLPGDEVVQLLLKEADALAWRACAYSQELYEKYGGAPSSFSSILPPSPCLLCEFTVDKGAYRCELPKGHAGPCGSRLPVMGPAGADWREPARCLAEPDGVYGHVCTLSKGHAGSHDNGTYRWG